MIFDNCHICVTSLDIQVRYLWFVSAGEPPVIEEHVKEGGGAAIGGAFAIIIVGILVELAVYHFKVQPLPMLFQKQKTK